MLYIQLDIGKNGLIYGHLSDQQQGFNDPAIVGKTVVEVLHKIIDQLLFDEEEEK